MAFAGFTAGLLGIGGALIFNPVLLQLGVQPQVSPAMLPPVFSSTTMWSAEGSICFMGLHRRCKEHGERSKHNTVPANKAD